MHIDYKELHLLQVTGDNLIDNVSNFNERVILHLANELD
jgi:hypothetical protein